MKSSSLLKALFLFGASFLFVSESLAVYPATCPTMQKRNNGNGQWGSCAGQGSVAVASNVASTAYANFFTTYNIDPSTKTGDINFYWPGVTNINELYVITRVWVGTTILPTRVGPPPVPEVRNGNTYATYCFYVANLPNAGVLTLEFTNPVTNQPAYLCAFDLKSGATVTPAVSCAPTINTQPQNKVVCTDTTSFRIDASGAASYQWQVSSNGTSWSNITGAPFTGFTTSVLSIGAPASAYNNHQFRVVLTGSGSCGTTTSSAATLTAYPKPTATFAAGAIVCGVGTYNLRIDFTGTGPWSFTYTTNGVTPGTTVSNIAASPYYLPVSPTATTTYAITALNDRYCANYSVSAPVTIVVQDKPTITVTSPVYYCFSNTMGTATLSYTATTNSPTQYSITPGTRGMGGFNNVINASNTFNSGSGTLGISIPASIAAGTYDFNIRVKVASPGSGCESVDVPFTIIVRPAPSIVATSSASSVCLNGNVTLSASPDLSSSGFTYAWTGAAVASPSAVSTSATVTADPSTYTVTVTQPGTGCTASSSVTVTLKAGAAITVNNATICSGDRAVLTASGGVTYSWSLSPSGSVSGTLSSTTGSTVLANPTTTTTYRVTGTSSTGCAGFADATVTVNSGLNVTVTSSASICPGGSISLTANNATSYSWAPTSSLSASTGATVTATPSSTTTYTVTGTTGSCSGSASTTVTVNNPVTDPPPTKVLYCQADLNANRELGFSFTTNSNVTCKWFHNPSANTFTSANEIIVTTSSGNQIWRSESNSTSIPSTSTLTFKSPTTSTAKYVKLEVYSGSCTLIYYTELVEISAASPTFSAISNQTICSGSVPSTLRLDAIASGGTSSTTFSYQWDSSTNGTNFFPLTGKTATTYQPTSLSVDRWYRIGVTANNGSCAGTDYSTSVKITVVSGISGNTISGTNCASGAATLTGSSIASGTYQWQSSSNGSTWSDIPGASGQNYTAASVLTQKTWFRRRVTVGSCTDVSTSTILTPAILGNEISTGQTVCSGTSLSTLGPVSPSGGEGTYTYQWESSATGSSWGAEAGATSSSFAPTVAAGTTKYFRVVVTSGSCASISNQSIITVNALPTISTSGGNVSVCQGLSTTLTATGAVSYTWSPSTDLNLTAGEKVISTPTATRTYTITGTDANGCVNTGTVTVTLNTLPTAPTSNGTTTSNQCYSGSVPSIDLNTTFITGTVSSPLAYQWFTESTNPPVSAPVTNPTTTAGTYYAFTRNTSTGCFSSTSITATLNYINNAAPVPLTNSFTACSPATYNLLSAEPTAPSGTTWEWQTSATYNTANAVGTPTAVSSGTYYLYGRNSTCTTASAAVTVTINSLPLSSVTVSVEAACYPNKVNISDNYTNTGAIYQWYTVNSNPSPATLVTDPTSVGGDSGTTTDYYLYVTNPTTLCRSSSAAAVAVTINKRPKLNIASPALSCEGSSVNIVGSSNLAATYQWYTVNTTTGSATSLSNSSPYSNVTTNTLSVNPTTGLSSNLFYFTATSTTGSCLSTSDMVPIPLQTNVSCATQPSSKFVGSLPGGTFFSFTVDDFNAEIQWQVSTNGGGSWRNILGTGGNNATLYYGYNTTRLDLLTVHDSMNNFQYRAIATTSPCTIGCTTNAATLTTPISLPVSGMKLVGTKTGQHLELRWFVLSEEDVQYYQVEYAENGRDFVPMGKVFVANPSFTSRSYNYLVPLKKGYYRIQATSERLASVYSNLYWYNATDAIKTGINPNPVQAEKGIMQLSVSGVDHEIPFKVNVHGVDGRLIQSAEMMMQTGTHAFRLSENALSGSIVILSIVHPDLGVIERRKVVIQH
ncbi:MAG: beta strand repeat-containing protein [Sphingomonadales bacterium]